MLRWASLLALAALLAVMGARRLHQSDFTLFLGAVLAMAVAAVAVFAATATGEPAGVDASPGG